MTQRTPDRITQNGLQIAAPLYAFIEKQVLPGTGVSSSTHSIGGTSRAVGMR